MSCGNYHLTIATTLQALTEDDVTASLARQERLENNRRNTVSRTFSDSQKIELCVLRFG